MRAIRKWLSIKKEKNAQLLILIGIIVFNICLWIIASLAAFLLDNHTYPTIFDALSRSIMWLLDPGTYNPDVTTALKFVSVLIIIVAMVTFSGGIIAYVANAFSEIIENSKKGKGKLDLYNHIVILNWNSKILELIVDYQYSSKTTDIVILSNENKLDIEEQIKNKMYETTKNGKTSKVNIIVREGDVFAEKSLDRICIQKAKTIIILSNDHDENKTDILCIKALMIVSSKITSKDQTIIIEVKEESSLNLIKLNISNSYAPDQIIPFLTDELMGRLIAQTLLIPHISEVYHEILSYEGAEFYPTEENDIEHFLQYHSHAIPISVRDNIFALSSHQRHLAITRKEPLVVGKKIKLKKQIKYKEKTVVIFGTNRKYKYIIDSIKLYEKDCDTTVNVVSIPTNDPERIKSSVNELSRIDAVLILSEDSIEPKNYDSDALITLLLIHDIAKKHQADIVIELLNPKHYDIAQKYNINNVIVSNIYISRIMTQISKSRKLYSLFYDLLTFDDENNKDASYEIYTYRADEIINEEFPITFNSKSELIYSFYTSSKSDFTLIGLIKNNHLDIFKENLDLNEKIIIDKEDYLIMLNK